jgi:hypothetical protein
LDLWLRAPAACALPLPWNCDLTLAKTMVSGANLTNDAGPRARAERRAMIARDVVAFCRRVRAAYVAVEDYAYGAGGARALELGELGGVVKDALLRELGLEAHPVGSSSARKVLLQRVPRLPAGKTKPWVVRNVRRLGGPALGWTEDECDAFVVANWALERAGGVALSFPGA